MKHLKNIKDWKECINSVVCGDCLEGMSLIPDNVVDLIITDPPYILDDSSAGNSKIMSLEKFGSEDYKKITNGFDIDIVFRECERVSKKLNMFCFCSNKQVSDIMRFGENNGYITNLLVWHKKNAPPFANGVWKSDLEFCVHIRANGTTFQGEAKVKSKLYQSNLVTEKFHPTTKPIDLISRYIEIGSNKEDIILDPFMGSWTTARACKDLNRNFIGFELEEKYCEIGEKRLEQLNLF